MSHNPVVYGPGAPNKTVAIKPIISLRDPVSSDINHPLGQPWVNKVNDTYFVLVDVTAGAGTWLAANISGAVLEIDGDSGSVLPAAGVVNILGTPDQIVTTGSGDTLTLALDGPYAPATYTDHGVLVGSGSSDITALSVGATGTLLAGVTGADPAFTGSPSVSGSLTAGTTITATLGSITATNGNFVRGTAGNKDVYSSVATNATAGANSAGTVTLIGGTETVATTAVTASSLIRLYRQGIGSTGNAATGNLSVGTITAGVSFVINSVDPSDATSLQASDVSVVFWEIVN